MTRVAFVTGGAGGIGAAICRSLADAGHRVIVADLLEERASEVAAEIDGLGVALDVTSPESVTAAFARAGAVDICVNCAGWEQATPFLETDEAFTAKILEINLHGPIRVTRAAVGGMIDRGWGRVINVSSDAALLGSSLSPIYAAAKGGLISFTKSIARDAGRSAVTANVVSPGAINTPLLVSSMGDNYERVRKAILRAAPLGRIGEPEEVAAAVAFYASEEASYVTGQTISVGGGQAMP